MTNNPAKPQTFNVDEWVSKSEAAELRGVSRQAIWELVKRGRLTTFVFERRKYLYRSEVLNFQRRPRGPSMNKTGAFKKKNFDSSKWISQIDAAEVMGVTRQVISDLIRRRRLRTLVSGGKTMVSYSSVKKFMAQQRKLKPKAKPAKKK